MWFGQSASRKIRMMFIITPGCIFLALLLWSLITDWRRCGFDVSAAEANAQLDQYFELPAEATHINFCTSPWYSNVEMKIPEEDFLSWCDEKGWSVEKIPADRPAYLYIVDEQTRDPRFEIVQHGYSFSDMQGDNGFSGIFDHDRQKASVGYTIR